MPSRPIYPTEITPEEEVAGFRRMEIEHPHLKYGVEDRVRAVAYPFRKCYRLLKRWHPSILGRHYFSLEVFGVFSMTPNARPEWQPIVPPGHANLYENGADPNLVVEALGRWIDEGGNKHYLPRNPEASKE